MYEGLIRIEDNTIVCPYCKKEVFADIYEYDENGIPTEDGFHIWCDDPDIIKPCLLSYDEGLILSKQVHKWLTEEYFSAPP